MQYCEPLCDFVRFGQMRLETGIERLLPVFGAPHRRHGSGWNRAQVRFRRHRFCDQPTDFLSCARCPCAVHLCQCGTLAAAARKSKLRAGRSDPGQVAERMAWWPSVFRAPGYFVQHRANTSTAALARANATASITRTPYAMRGAHWSRYAEDFSAVNSCAARLFVMAMLAMMGGRVGVCSLQRHGRTRKPPVILNCAMFLGFETASPCADGRTFTRSRCA